MYKQYHYCIHCGEYLNKNNKCDCSSSYIPMLRATKNIIDRLHYLGFKVLGSRLIPDKDCSNRTHLEVHFKLIYSDWLLQELPEGWYWSINPTAFDPVSYLGYTAEVKYGVDEYVIFDKAIASLEAYLNKLNAEGIQAAMLLMYD